MSSPAFKIKNQTFLGLFLTSDIERHWCSSKCIGNYYTYSHYVSRVIYYYHTVDEISKVKVTYSLEALSKVQTIQEYEERPGIDDYIHFFWRGELFSVMDLGKDAATSQKGAGSLPRSDTQTGVAINWIKQFNIEPPFNYS